MWRAVIHAEVSGGGGLVSVPLQLYEEERWWLCAVACCSLGISRYCQHRAGTLASQDQDTVTMIACGIADYGLVQVDATEYLHVISFVFFCSCFYVAKILTLLHCIMIYYSQYRAFTKLMFRCSDAVLHPGSWQPTPIITTSSPPSWPQLPAWLGLGLGPARPGGVNSSKTKPEDVSLNPHSWIWQQ